MTTLAKAIEGIIEVDRAVLRRLASARQPAVDLLMRGFTRAGDWQTWTVLGAAAVSAGGEFRAIAGYVLPRILSTWSVCFAIKKLSRRQRPGRILAGFRALVKDPDPYSFPSSHSACAWAGCVALSAILPGAAPVLLGYAAMISYSRVHLGAHFPLDVLIGSFIGIVIGLV